MDVLSSLRCSFGEGAGWIDALELDGVDWLVCAMDEWGTLGSGGKMDGKGWGSPWIGTKETNDVPRESKVWFW